MQSADCRLNDNGQRLTQSERQPSISLPFAVAVGNLQFAICNPGILRILRNGFVWRGAFLAIGAEFLCTIPPPLSRSLRFLGGTEPTFAEHTLGTSRRIPGSRGEVRRRTKRRGSHIAVRVMFSLPSEPAEPVRRSFGGGRYPTRNSQYRSNGKTVTTGIGLPTPWAVSRYLDIQDLPEAGRFRVDVRRSHPLYPIATPPAHAG